MDGMVDGAREALRALAERHKADYAALSRLIGRNPAYIHQYVTRGTPRRLAERDRRVLARFFGVPETMLGAPEDAAPARHVAVPRLDVSASAGPGALVEGETPLGHLAFDPAWLRRIGSGDPARLSLVRVSGDSMAPTLADGEEILVDGGDGAGRLRDGIYVLRIDDALVVKRIALRPDGRALSVLSDNPAAPDWPDCDPARLRIVGRVVWAARRVG